MIERPKRTISRTARFVRIFIHPVIWPSGRVELCIPPVLLPVEWIFNQLPDAFRDRMHREIGWIVDEELSG